MPDSLFYYRSRNKKLFWIVWNVLWGEKIFIFFPLLQSDSTAIFLGRSGRNWSFSLSTQRPNRGQSNLFGLPRWAAGKELALNLQTNNSKQLLITCVFGIFGGTLLQTAVSHGNKISLTYKKSYPLSRFPQNLIMNDIQVEDKVLFFNNLTGTTHPRNRQEEDSPKHLFTKSQLPRPHVVSAAESSVTSTGSVTWRRVSDFTPNENLVAPTDLFAARRANVIREYDRNGAKRPFHGFFRRL